MSKAVKGVTKAVSSVVGGIAGTPVTAQAATAPAAIASNAAARFQPVFTNEIFARNDLKYTGAFANGDFNRWLADPTNSAANANYQAWLKTNQEGALPSPPKVNPTSSSTGGQTVVEQVLPAAAQEQDPIILTAVDNERKRRQRAAAGNDTIINGYLGDTGAASTANKQLLGV